MPYDLPPPWRYRLSAVFALSVTFACSANEPPPVFGGQGAEFDAKQTPLSQAPEEDLYTGPCAKPAPASKAVLFEDFEDTDNQLFKAFQREGWWYVAVDETQGSVYPDVGDFKATALPDTEATTENRHALHGKASGFSDWGVVWGTTLKWTDGSVKCPFNASHFEGLRFRAKGTGSLHVKIGNPATVPGEYEGRCKDRCWDVHGQRFPLTPEWRDYVVRWDRVQQGGWGAEAEFDPTRLLHFNFAVDGKDLPVEFWVDDVRFVMPGEDTNASAPALRDDHSPPDSTNPDPGGLPAASASAPATAPSAQPTTAPTAAPAPRP